MRVINPETTARRQSHPTCCRQRRDARLVCTPRHLQSALHRGAPQFNQRTHTASTRKPGADDMRRISIAYDFSDIPGGGYRREGPNSREVFREDLLLPALRTAERKLMDQSGHRMGRGASQPMTVSVSEGVTGIEEYFRVLKSGCKVEELQHHTAERLERAMAIKMVIGWRIQLMIQLGREVPDLPGELLFPMASCGCSPPSPAPARCRHRRASATPSVWSRASAGGSGAHPTRPARSSWARLHPTGCHDLRLRTAGRI